MSDDGGLYAGLAKRVSSFEDAVQPTQGGADAAQDQEAPQQELYKGLAKRIGDPTEVQQTPVTPQVPGEGAAPPNEAQPMPQAGEMYRPATPDQPQRPSPATEEAKGMTMDLYNAMQAGQQRTSPHVRDVHGNLNYELAPQEQQDLLNSDLGWTNDESKYVVLRDPADGQQKVFVRNSRMAESAAPALGRVLGFGMNAPAPDGLIPNGINKAGQIVKDFEQAGVEPTFANTSDSGFLNTIQKWGGNLPLVGSIFKAKEADQLKQVSDRASEIASRFGSASDAKSGGEAIGQGVTKAISNFYDKADELWEKFKGSMTGNPLIDPVNTRAAMSGPVDRFPNAPGLGQQITNPKMAAIGRSLEPQTVNVPAQFWKVLDESGNPVVKQAAETYQKGGKISFDELWELRSWLGKQIKAAPGERSIPLADLQTAYGAITNDLESAIKTPQQGMLWNQANAFYKQGKAQLQNSLTPLAEIGSDEKRFAKVLQMADKEKGDIDQLSQLAASVPREQWGEFTAGVLANMGRAKPGVQNAEGSVFSPATFLTNYNKMSDKAKTLLFNRAGAGELRGALDTLDQAVQAAQMGNKNAGDVANLARVIERLKETNKATNWSNTANHGTAGFVLFDLLEHGLDASALKVGAPAYIGAKLMTNPAFVKWMAGTTGAKTLTEVGRRMGALDYLARTNPDISPAIDELKRRWNDAVPGLGEKVTPLANFTRHRFGATDLPAADPSQLP